MQAAKPSRNNTGTAQRAAGTDGKPQRVHGVLLPQRPGLPGQAGGLSRALPAP